MENFSLISYCEPKESLRPIETRNAKLARLKQAIGEGTYEIDSKELANILIAKMILQKSSSSSR